MLTLGLTLTGCAGTLPIESPEANNNPLLQQTPGVDSSNVPKGEETAPDAGVAIDPMATVGTDAGAPAEAAPTQAPVEQQPVEPPPADPAVAPTVNPAFGSVQLPSAADLEVRWRDMQVDRAPFDAPRTFVSSGSEIVWWFDPLFGQLVPIGEIRGEFVAQAGFRIKGQWIGALEIPYQVNQAYGIVVPEPILQRMQNAGKGEWAEVFVYQTGDITQR